MSAVLHRTDWRAVMAELRANGWSTRAVERHFGFSKGRLGRLVGGDMAEPPHSLGEALLTLLAEARAGNESTGREPAITEG